jgi:hypothetical protein
MLKVEDLRIKKGGVQMKEGDRVRIKKEYAGINGSKHQKGYVYGKIVSKSDNMYNLLPAGVKVLLDSGAQQWFGHGNFDIVGERGIIYGREYQTTDKPITIKSLILSKRFGDESIEYFMHDFALSDIIPLFYVFSWLKEGDIESLLDLLDCGFISIVEERNSDHGESLICGESNAKEALKEAVSGIYFGDSSDYLSALWTIVLELGGEDAYVLLQEDARAAFEKYCED